jgi:hypothetical protein
LKKLQNFGAIHSQSPKNCENVLFECPLLKFLKAGLETSNWYQIEALGELFSKLVSNWGLFIEEFRKSTDGPSKFEEIGDPFIDMQ